jgi:hypothetical protein
MNLDSLKPEPIKDTVTLETDPPGAQARAATGETCTTPCALALPSTGPTSVTFTLAGHAPATEQLELVAQGDGTSRLQPNPVSVELAAAAPAAPARKPAPRKPARKPTAAKPAPQPAAAAAPAAPAPAPTTTGTSPSPWPDPQQPAR